MRPRKTWLLATLALAGCGLSAAAIGGLVGGAATAVSTAATVYVVSQPSATATASPMPSAESTPGASPTPAIR